MSLELITCTNQTFGSRTILITANTATRESKRVIERFFEIAVDVIIQNNSGKAIRRSIGSIDTPQLRVCNVENCVAGPNVESRPAHQLRVAYINFGALKVPNIIFFGTSQINGITKALNCAVGYIDTGSCGIIEGNTTVIAISGLRLIVGNTLVLDHRIVHDI